MLMAMLFTSGTVWSEDFEVGGIYYDDITPITSSCKTVAVTYKGHNYFDYDEYSGIVTIPETVTYNDTTYNVTSIGDYAFKDCDSLTSVNIPNSVIGIGFEAFKNTGWYNKQPNDILYLDNCCLGYKDSRSRPSSHLSIKTGTRLIADYAFLYCNGLTSVDIPNSVISIGDFAFSICALTNVDIPNSVISIGRHAFFECYYLTSVIFGNSVSKVGNSAFGSCDNLKSVHISDLESWVGIDFYDITANPLYNAMKLYVNSELVSDVRIEKSTEIKRYTFVNCSSLTSVTFANSVTSIGNRAFALCTGLKSVIIPNSVTSIENLAFYLCTGLTNVSIGNSVASIGEQAFYGCSSISSIVSANPVPPTCELRVFTDVNKKTTKLFVPQKSISLYETADTWMDFLNILGEDMSTMEETLADDAEEPAEYYTLQGVKVENPKNGVYVKKQGSRAIKVLM